MTGTVISKPWTGTPKPNDNTYILSGTIVAAGVEMPVGNLGIWTTSAVPTSFTVSSLTYTPVKTPGMNPYYHPQPEQKGSYFDSGFALRSFDTSGAGVDLIFADMSDEGFLNDGSITDAQGTLRLLSTTGGQVMNTIGGTMFAAAGASTDFNITIQTDSLFSNYGAMGALGSATTQASNMQITLGNGTYFDNYGTLEAAGAHTQVGVVAATVGGPDQSATSSFNGSILNTGLIQSSVGGAVFLTAPVIGTGNMQTNGGLIKLSAPVSSGQTINITSGTLEFGSPGTFAKPAMQFVGQISGMTADSTILLDGAVGISDVFKVISAAGAGTSELQVFGAGNQEIADFHLTGHYTASEFHVTPHVGASLDTSYTAVTFTNSVLNYVPHS